GFEVLIDNFKDIDKMLSVVYHSIGYDLDALSIKQLYPQIFDWLELQNMNVVIILVLMLLVSGVTMISTLLILIIERTNMIGILKALGSKNKSIRKIFLYNASYLIVKGLFYGNVFGLLLCLLQKYFRIIKLPEETYYVSAVPINLNLFHILYLNAGAFIICFFMLIIPSMIVAKISPIKTIRYN
ncbi:MAG: ABC transporter permease, partial [Bacteroidales bacterium]|nr:ABC transporter permease [Bacteroidales bacterium]